MRNAKRAAQDAVDVPGDADVPAQPRGKVSTSAERAYDRIKLMAISYTFRPGERINELDLARQLDVSRTPVREALSRLVTEGFLTSIPNRGFFCRTLDARQIHDLYEFRVSLERAIILLVCERASDQELQELADFVHESDDVEDGSQAVALLQRDEEFHVRLARLTRNAEFVKSLQSVNSRIHFVRWVDMRSRAVGQEAHLRIVALLRQRRGEECAQAVAEQIFRRHDQIVEIIRRGIAEIYYGPEDAAPTALP